MMSDDDLFNDDIDEDFDGQHDDDISDEHHVDFDDDFYENYDGVANAMMTFIIGTMLTLTIVLI